MKFKEKVCGNCGLDLTTVEAEDVREMPLKGEMVFLGECPKCHTNRIMAAPIVAVKPVLKPKVEKAKVTEKKPEPKA